MLYKKLQFRVNVGCEIRKVFFYKFNWEYTAAERKPVKENTDYSIGVLVVGKQQRI